MNVLGINHYFHDTSVYLVAGGKLVVALEEERFNCDKHTEAFPERAAAKVFACAGVTPADVMHVAVSVEPTHQWPAKLAHAACHPRHAREASRHSPNPRAARDPTTARPTIAWSTGGPTAECERPRRRTPRSPAYPRPRHRAARRAKRARGGSSVDPGAPNTLPRTPSGHRRLRVMIRHEMLDARAQARNERNQHTMASVRSTPDWHWSCSCRLAGHRWQECTHSGSSAAESCAVFATRSERLGQSRGRWADCRDARGANAVARRHSRSNLVSPRASVPETRSRTRISSR